MYYYDYDAFESDMNAMLPDIRAFEPDTILALARGGMIGAQLLGYALDIRNIKLLRVASYDGEAQRETVSIEDRCDLRNARRVLIVDDIVDSGKTLEKVRAHLLELYPGIVLKCAAPWYKTSAAVLPEFRVREATEWIEFFWDRFGA